MFHHFHNEDFPKVQGSISGKELTEIIDFIGRERILRAEEWVEKFQQKSLSKKHVCLTFDDGHLSQYEVALPILESFDLTGFWFVYSSVFKGIKEKLEIYRFFRTTQFKNIDEFYVQFFRRLFNSPFAKIIKKSLERFDSNSYLKNHPFYTENDRKFRFIRDEILQQEEYFSIMDEMILYFNFNENEITSKLWMNENQLKILKKKKHIIGLHSYSHPMKMSGLSIEDQREEYTQNYNHLKELVGDIITMSHPSNSYNDDTLNISHELGIKLGFRADMLKIDGGNLEYPREDHANIMRILQGK